MKVGRTPDLMTDVDGGLSQAAVSETNGAEHDGGAAADGTDFQIGQSKHEVLLHLSCSQGLCRSFPVLSRSDMIAPSEGGV